MEALVRELKDAGFETVSSASANRAIMVVASKVPGR
jgi:hypothetical protein